MTVDSTMTPTGDAPATLRLPDAPAHLRPVLEAGGAIAWSEPIEIRTYAPQEPSPYPMYLDHRVYQGSSGRVYPLPFYERIASDPEPRLWQAIHLENRYVRLVVLPELGGRIHIGYDKTTGYDFFYRNTVIKPALVGLTGPWISGGVEFNWPQHHRPATFLPVDTAIEESEDGSVVVWCSDHDPFARMQGTHGIRLYPDSSIVQLDVRLHNRTSERQTFLWWANVAVRVHDDYQSFFPEDVRYVADHARRSLTTFPAADRPYYGVDYPARAAETEGADRIDWYRNIPVPTSYMIVDTEDDFFGGYDHAAKAGFVHWADRRVAPGKKQWTWGDAPFGHAWDALLTDDDGPYVELMAGVYTDNQPDFSWLAPGETKRFSQFWYPIPGIGVVHQATPQAAVHVERDGELAALFAVTSSQLSARAVFRAPDGSVLAEHVSDLEPGRAWSVTADAPWMEGATVELIGADGDVLVRWALRPGDAEEPWTATEPAPPSEVDSVDELYLTGLHLLQYRHPTRSPLLYWNEALRRDPQDSRVRIALADLAYRSGDYDGALRHLEIALARVTRRNGNPRDAEGYYLLGLVQARRGRTAAAEAAWAKAAWDGAYAAPAGLELARAAARAGRATAALAQLAELDAVAANDRRRALLRVVLLRRTGRHDEARSALEAALREDPLSAVLRFLRDGGLGDDGLVLKDVALELARAGDLQTALEALGAAAAAPAGGAGNVAPLAHYHRARLLDDAGRHSEAGQARRAARAVDQRWVFPAGLDDHDALVAAVLAEGDVVARGLLGMLLYDAGRRREALEQWNRAILAGSTDPIVHRNAGLASYNVAHDDEAAVQHYERALALDPHEPRLIFERDQLAQRLGESAARRLERLESTLDSVLRRDDLVIEYVDLLIAVGRAEEALALFDGRVFQPWEGGEGRVLGAWDRARAAVGLPQATPPASLGEARTEFVAPVARHTSGETDYFATSLPELLLFARE
jgi:tetratricopeptide (TPR) repeat protein